LSIEMTSVDALRDAVPGVDVDAAVASAGTEGGRVQLELLMESLEIAAAQLLTVPGVAVEEPAELRRRLFERGQDLVARHRPGGRRGAGALRQRAWRTASCPRRVPSTARTEEMVRASWEAVIARAMSTRVCSSTRSMTREISRTFE